MCAEGAFQQHPANALGRCGGPEKTAFSRLHALIEPLTIGGRTVEDLLTTATARLEGSDCPPAGELARRLLGCANELEYNAQVALVTERRSSSRKGARVNG